MSNYVSYHKAALRAFRRSFFPALILCLSQILAWFVFICSTIITHKHFGVYSLCFSIPCLMLVLIYRLFVANRLARLIHPQMPPLKAFIQLIPSSGYRMIKGCFWASAFIILLYRFYQYVFIFPATAFTTEFSKLGAYIAKDATTASQLLIGTIVFFACLVLSLIFFVYGWRRGLCFDIAQVKPLSFRKSLRKARTIRKRTRKARFVNTLLHTIILLPALILPLIPLIMQIYPLLSGKAMKDIQLLFMYLSAGIISNKTLLLSAGIFLILYLPFLPFRKLHNTAAMVIRHD